VRIALASENTVLALAFIMAIALPLAEIVLRALFGVGIQGVAALTQNLTLCVGMLGAAVAAREQRLLALTLTSLFTGRCASIARFASGTVSTLVCAMLTLAALELVSVEYGGGNELPYGIPVWIAQLPLPLGLALIALRLAWHAGASVNARLVALALAAAAVAVLYFARLDPEQVLLPALIVLGLATALGAPIFVLVGGAALFLLQANGNPAAAVAVDQYSLVINPSLPAIPMFTLAGYLLAESGAPRRLIDVFDALFGRLRGGPAIVTVLACTFFTSFTGASGVTILALGGLALPLLLKTGYRERSALGLVTAAGLPGTLLMPSLPLILYAIVAGISIRDMFIGGVLPTLLMVTIVASWGIWRQPAAAPEAVQAFDWRRARRALAKAKWELSLPLAPIVSMASGFATPVEAAAITALYALIITTVIHRDIEPVRALPRVICECALVVGGILLIMGVALGLTDYLVDAQVPQHIVAWVTSSIGNRFLFLLVLNAVLLLSGCVMEIYPAILVLAPLVTHIGRAFDIHPVHLGIIFLANMELGYLTPLVGLNLFFASARFRKPIIEVFHAALPLFFALGAGVLAITYVPWLSTGLLSLVR
jgi:tripartite ATP-independent transporter DctM subunit